MDAARSLTSTRENATEVLVLDSSTFVEEIGLTSRDASALKHYLYHRGTRLVVPQVVVEECERHLAARAKGKRESVEQCIGWLSRFCGRVSGWQAPSDAAIEERARVLAKADQLGAVVVPESEVIHERAESRNRAERPPSHLKAEPGDCRVWEHCLDLLADYDVLLVSRDSDFRGRRWPDQLHPQLQTEAAEVGKGRSFTLHLSMESLLSELKSEIPAIPNDVVYAFVYAAISEEKRELESNSGCRPKKNGAVKQTLLTTDQLDIIEVRLELDDQWESIDGSNVCDFLLRGSCHYRLSDHQLSDLSASSVTLLITESDGSVRAVKGSYVSAAATLYAGARPVEPEHTTLG